MSSGDARAEAAEASRGAAVKERDEYDGWREYWLDRAQKAEASLTRYRNAQEELRDAALRAAERETKARDTYADGVSAGLLHANGIIARAALDGPKEVAGTHGATEIPGREYE